MNVKLIAIPASAALALAALAGCASSNSAAPSATASSSAPTAGASASSPPSGASPSSTSADVPAKVDANTATQLELAAAFTAAGVPNADRWAREVTEYRPYSGSDEWAHLRTELDKYNIDDDTFAKIVSVLEV